MLADVFKIILIPQSVHRPTDCHHLETPYIDRDLLFASHVNQGPHINQGHLSTPQTIQNRLPAIERIQLHLSTPHRGQEHLSTVRRPD